MDGQTESVVVTTHEQPPVQLTIGRCLLALGAWYALNYLQSLPPPGRDRARVGRSTVRLRRMESDLFSPSRVAFKRRDESEIT